MHTHTPRRPLALLIALLASLLALPALAGPTSASPAAPARLELPISLYAEDLSLWSPERVDEALALADRYLDRCHIDLTWGPVKPLRPSGAARPATLWQTGRPEEVVVLLRAPNDRRHYRLAGVANMFRVNGRWLAEGPWSNVALALAQVIGRGELTRWPRPSGPDAGDAIAKSRLAMMFAVAKGWITLEPAVSAEHCAFLYKRFDTLRQRGARGPLVRPALHPAGRAVRLTGTPTALLAADVPNADGHQLAVREGDRWRLVTWLEGIGPRLERASLPAVGEGRALLRVGGASLLLSAQPAGGVFATWGHPYPKHRGRLRPDRALKGCDQLLVADRVSAAGEAAEGDPGVAAVVCRDRVVQLAPLPAHAERTDRLPPMTWATLTRWGQGRSRLIAMHATGVRVYEIWPGYPPRPVDTPPAIAALAAARPQAPIWQGLGAAPVQLDGQTLYGPGGARPLGEGAQGVFNPQQYRALRLKAAEDGSLTAREDGLYPGDVSGQAKVPKGALWATQVGPWGPSLWTLAREGRRWIVRAPAVPPAAPRTRAKRSLKGLRFPVAPPPGTRARRPRADVGALRGGIKPPPSASPASTAPPSAAAPTRAPASAAP